MREFNPNGPVDLASGLQQKVNQDLQSLRTYNSRANTVDAQAAEVAEQPMKLVNAALGFSKTLKDKFDANKEEREKKQIAAFDLDLKKNGITTESYDSFVKFKEESHKDQAKLEEYVNKNYNEEQAKFLRSLGKGRLLIGSKLVAQKNAASMPLAWADFQRTPVTLADGRVVTWMGTESAADQQEYYDAFIIKQIADGKLDESAELYQETYKPAFDSLYNTAVSIKSQKKVTEYDKEYEAANQEFVFNAAHNPDGNKGVEDFIGFVNSQTANHGGDLGKTFDAVYDKYIFKMIENAQLTRDQYDTFISGVMDHKGMGKVSMEKGMGKKLRTFEIDQLFRKNEVEAERLRQEVKKAKYKKAEEVAIEQLEPGLKDGTKTIADIELAEGELKRMGYESTKLNNMKEGYTGGTAKNVSDNEVFQKAYNAGTLTEAMLDKASFENKQKWLKKAKESEATRKGAQYKLQKKNVEGIVRQQFGKLLDSVQSPQGGEVQGFLNRKFEGLVNKYIEEMPENIPLAVDKAAVEVITHFKNNQGEGQDFFVNKAAYEVGGDVFPVFRANQDELIKNYASETAKTNLVFAQAKLHTSTRVVESGNLEIALDQPNVFLNENQWFDAVNEINQGGGPTEWMKYLQSTYPKIDSFEIIRRQGLALGYEEDDIPTKPEYLDVVESTASPDLVCLMRKIGIQNLPEQTAKRLCISMDPDGINNEQLMKALYGDQPILRNNSEE